MKKRSCLILAFCLGAALSVSAQEPRLPRDTEKLLDRVQKFWSAMTARQRLQALEFVLPESRDLFASGSSMPILKARVLGLDLTSNPSEAAVRVSLDVLSADAGAVGQANWTITDSWVWQRGNWYVKITSPPNVFQNSGSRVLAGVKVIQDELAKSFEMLQSPIDLGTLTDEQYFNVEVPIRYTGELPLLVELSPENPLVAVGADPITSKSTHLTLLVGTQDWEGAFDLPLKLTLKAGEASIERSLVVKGNVFPPVSFRLSPLNALNVHDREFSLFIRNNTDEQAKILSVLTDAKLQLVQRPPALLPRQEVEVVFKQRPGQSPDVVNVELDAPIKGRKTYTYRFRKTLP